MSMVICDTEKKLQLMLDSMDETPSLKTAVVIQNLSDEIRSAAKDKGLDVCTFDEMVVSDLMGIYYRYLVPVF